MNDDLKNMLEQRKQALGFQKPKPASPAPSIPSTPSGNAVECFKVVAPQGYSEHFLDLRFRDGNKVAFPYAELSLINFDAAESKLDLNFRGYWVAIYGVNLESDLYESLRDCRVRWIAEAPEAQPSAGVVPFIERIEIIPPEDTPNSEDEEWEAASEEEQIGA